MYKKGKIKKKNIQKKLNETTLLQKVQEKRNKENKVKILIKNHQKK